MLDYDVMKLENQTVFPLYACCREIIKSSKASLDRLELTYTQYLVMLVLWEKESLTVKEIGERLYLDSGTLTPLLKKLAEKGLLTRNRSTEDERNLIVTITTKGDHLRLRALAEQEVINRIPILTAEEKEMMVAFAHRILQG